MNEEGMRILEVKGETVSCLPDKLVTLDRCRFCSHSRYFEAGGMRVISPARAYCSRSGAGDEVDLKAVTRVWCDDMVGEGYRSIMSIIS
ncbi:MAG: hypothetical protein XE11_0302 [Methanomicrobiales archaeon 53_19]|jgi:hypothetical protein|uniref:hypothetical protein n=1 Tax=Methanocalculus sp. TaxID=2004547 RepID=UPI000749C6B2|nr:hypothetical protein [Methanocalculus sp.]KUK70985.1 MAG: hypothetical protein XD88_0335 [Methanocalculus sp. 52_23]KUL04867.1 MAG: hypothetical protein XE11_0302 [Methanomicrobiales archaeon 53_19]